MKPRISHPLFCLLFPTALYIIYNALNFEQISKWFYLSNQLDYWTLAAFLIIGLALFIAIFALLAHRYTIKPLAIFFVILSAAAAYFSAKYNVAIDRIMIMNALHTDPSEVHSLLSKQMLPYFFFLMLLPILAIISLQIKFKNPPKYLGDSAKIFCTALIIAVISLYTRFDGIARATNLSKKYIIHTIIPLNYIQSFGSMVQHFISDHHSKHAKKIEFSGTISKTDNLVVVLAIGETSRQENFSLYGYKRQNTTPNLSKIKNLNLLNGVARIGSTMYALPEILVKNDVPLPLATSTLGIDTSCYVNYTLYGICDSVGEIATKNCSHDGTCYDEDVIPLLSENLKSYTSGSRLIILHLGGGSHGPSYHERYPKEFQRFKPMCFDADVVNQCSLEQLYNSYDNTILYVDSVLSKIVNKLDKSGAPYVFIYLSDHGESLMENGRIFHGMPPGMALPPEQAHIPLLVKSSLPISIIKRPEYSQQDVFDTVLALFSIETSIRKKDGNFITKTK